MSPVVRLLAKQLSRPPQVRGEETLRGHTALVCEAAEELLKNCGSASLAATRLSEFTLDELVASVRLSAFIHDLGKCSDHFQAMLVGRRTVPQLIRHEALSLWLCWPGQPLADWLRAAVATDELYELAVIAGAGHHRKFLSRAFAPDDSGAGTSLKLLCAHADFASVLSFGESFLGLGSPPKFIQDIMLSTAPGKTVRRTFDAWEAEIEDRVRPGQAVARLLALMKALVICADVAGSALPRGHVKPRWISEQLSGRRGGEVFQRVVDDRLKGRPPRAFQVEVASSDSPITLVRAGCGTGKTVAAYLWHLRQHPSRQLWLTYPTTGTATEGFRDYLRKPDIVARLDHGRAMVDYELFELSDGEEGRESDRLDSIRAWGMEAISCTVDTVLGLTQNQRKGLYAWPGLVQGTVVFDEVHAYDDALFGALLRFLEAMPGVPVLLMTASLPADRLQSLRQIARRVHGIELPTISGPQDLECLPRYEIASQDADPWSLAMEVLERGGKVLWVSNTVDRAVSIWEEATQRGIRDPRLYHSRFRYIDRLRRHAEVIESFERPGSAFASTTQVAEMSLDLSADLLVTDLAPVPALIQRLGRLNRRSTPEANAGSKTCVVRQVGHPLPYTAEELLESRAWLSVLRGRVCSARDLTDAWTQREGPSPMPGESAWLDGRFHTTVAPLRGASPGITVLRSADAQAVLDGRLDPVEASIPMPPPRKGVAWAKWPTVKHLPVADDGFLEYSEERGGRWRK